jgi:hypothetical protein
MPVSVVARHTGLRWAAIKSIDKAYPADTIKPVAAQTPAPALHQCGPPNRRRLPL